MKWERRGAPSSHWTIALSDRWFLVCLLFLTVFHFFLSAILPPAADELYYWAWAQHLQGSYFDHPPMVALFIRFSTAVFGNNLFGIRFFACLLNTLIIFIVSLWTDHKTVLGLLLLTPIFFFGAILMTPDVPFLFFWTLYAAWLIHINKVFSNWSDDPVSRVYRSNPISLKNWSLGAVLLALGGMSKYSMLFAVLCGGFLLFTKYRYRAWVTGYLFHLVLAALLTVPVFYFNWKHGFVPLTWQWHHAMGHGTAHHFLEYIGTQILLLGALPFLMLPWAIVLGKEIVEDARLGVCYYFFLIPFVFFLIKATESNLEANWVLMAYLTFWPVAQRLLDQTSFRGWSRGMLLLGFAPPLICTLFLAVHTISPLKFVAPQKDRFAKLKAHYDLSQVIAQDIHQRGLSVPIFSPTYQWVAYLRYQHLPAEQIPDVGRPSTFTLEPQSPCSFSSVLVFSHEIDPTGPYALGCFKDKSLIKEYDEKVRGEVINKYYLIQYSNAR